MLSRIVISRNDLFFAFLLTGYLGGVILYDWFDKLGFSYTDELMALFLVLFAGWMAWERRSMKACIPLLIMLGIFLFYTLYSFAIRSNVPRAILMDLVIEMKPFLGFYCTCLVAPRLTQRQKELFAVLALIVGGAMLIIGLTGQIEVVFGHPSRFATAATITAFVYLYCCAWTWRDLLVFMLLLSVGFFSTRSKFYGFWVVALFLIVYLKAGGTVRFNWASILFICSFCLLALWVARDKIILYYVDGMLNSREMWSRPAMMLTAGQILVDDIPFGSGLASFGTFASAEYYSPIYAKYGIDGLYGISRATRFFITDAYYPSLAQFGIVGVGLYVLFWASMLRKGYQGISPERMKGWTIILLSFLFFLIEGIADATFTHNRGLYMLILTALTLNDLTTDHEVAHGEL
ncbi:MAG: hypothetical protein LBN06_07230 [Prevotellaceae bacterium]|jgi:hypothetical protein|nr:hypothetical protein [Prevotellaceae bacterium]